MHILDRLFWNCKQALISWGQSHVMMIYWSQNMLKGSAPPYPPAMAQSSTPDHAFWSYWVFDIPFVSLLIVIILYHLIIPWSQVYCCTSTVLSLCNVCFACFLHGVLTFFGIRLVILSSLICLFRLTEGLKVLLSSENRCRVVWSVNGDLTFTFARNTRY